ncbi:MAG: hypothetical protein V4760_14485 [Bdellovibrionota bacterium]
MKNYFGFTSILSFAGFAVAAYCALGGASMTSDKLAVLNKHSHPYGAAAKGGGQLEVSLATDVRSPIPMGTPFTLTASIIATSDLADLRYEWILPDGVTIAGGTAVGTIGDLVNGASVDRMIQLTTSTDDNRQVQLHVYRLVGGEPIGHMAQFNTRDHAKIAEEMHTKVQALGMTRSREPASERRKLMQ